MKHSGDGIVTLGGLASCDSCRRARRWLAERGVDAAFRDFRKDPPSEDELRRWAAGVGWETLLNRRGTTWRSLPAGARDGIDGERAVALMAAHPALVKRPVLETRRGLVVGVDEDAWARAVTS